MEDRKTLRTLCMLLCKAVRDKYPQAKILLEHPVSKGHYCKLLGIDASPQIVETIKQRMWQLLESNLPIEERVVSAQEAINMYEQLGMPDKSLLIKTTKQGNVTYNLLDGYADYFYAPLHTSTGAIKAFDLIPYNGGVLLLTPSTDGTLPKPIKQDKMFHAFDEYLQWQHIMHLDNVGDLNTQIQSNNGGQLIMVAEALQERKIVRIADAIKERAARIVLISGPSSSGKTTFSKRLSVQLMACGRHPYAISLDDYFVERALTPRDENGEWDYESLYALDLEQFSKDLNALLNGDTVQLPTYNFITGKREYNGHTLQLTSDMVLILEGIHALNPQLTQNIHSDMKYRVYVSALTTMSIDDHNWIPTTDTRLVRRIIRDSNYRGRSAKETIATWHSVRAGEDKWIFPFQEEADDMFNSALLFEFSFLRPYAEQLLSVNETNDISRFLSLFTPIPEQDIPRTSLMREFVGGSLFTY